MCSGGRPSACHGMSREGSIFMAMFYKHTIVETTMFVATREMAFLSGPDLATRTISDEQPTLVSSPMEAANRSAGTNTTRAL